MIKYPLATSTWDNKERESIQRVIDSDMFTMGNEVAEYEKEFARFFGSKYSIMVSSGSTANLLMIASLFFTKDIKRRLKKGDEIIVPSVSWSTTYFPLQQYGLKVKFVDICPDTLNIDINKLEAAISKSTKAILLVNLLGNPNDFGAIKALVENTDIVILEDNCESMGATYNEVYTGTFGLMGTFSSFFSHHIATMEGGCILTNDEELYHILLCIRAHGWTRNLPEVNKVTGIKDSNNFSEAFKFVLPGYNVRPLEMSGAIGREQLKKLPLFLTVRKQNAIIFKRLFKNDPYIKIQTETGVSSWFGFSMILKEQVPFTREELVELLEQNDIECRPIVTGNFLKNKEVLEYFDFEVAGDLSASEQLDRNGLFVGNHQENLTAQIGHLRSVLNQFYEKF